VSSARDAILARLRAAASTARLPQAEAPPPPERTPRSLAKCLSKFGEELAALGVQVFVEPTPDAVRARVAALAGDRRVLSWDPEHLPYGAGAALDRPIRASAPLVEQAAADVGITGCDSAIAETGSLVMLSAPGRSRTVSLLPPEHLAIVRPEDLVFSMGEFFARHAERVKNATSCTFITGPSRTADIELTLTLGIHGPGKVAVVIGPAAS
jgi:L-lactate dehydrogenase complex protein LldG